MEQTACTPKNPVQVVTPSLDPCSPTSRHSGWASSWAAKALPKPTMAAGRRPKLARRPACWQLQRRRHRACGRSGSWTQARPEPCLAFTCSPITIRGNMLKLAALLLACAAAAQAQTAAEAPPALQRLDVSRSWVGAGRARSRQPCRRRRRKAAGHGRRPLPPHLLLTPTPVPCTHQPLRRWSCAPLWRWTPAFPSTF